MINEELLIKSLQNGLEQCLKIKLLHEYANFFLTEGFEKGYQDHEKTMRIYYVRRRQGVIKRVNELLDEVRDNIWKRKEELEKLK